ncbi:MAG TPA: DUF4157 domain-containing protein [Chitinophagaceae bacterium]
MGFIGNKTGTSSTGGTTPFSLADSLPVQTKLTVSKASDPAEKEADSIAKKVVDEQKEKKNASMKEDKKEASRAPEPATEPNFEPNKEGIKKKEEKEPISKKHEPKKEIQKKNGAEEKEKPKAAKKDEPGSEKKGVNKKDDQKKEVQKKNGAEEKEKPKVAKKDEPGGEKKEPVSKMDDQKKEVQKKNGAEEKEKPKVSKKDELGGEKKEPVSKKDENNKEKKPVDKEKDAAIKPRSIQRKEAGNKKEKPQIQQKPGNVSRQNEGNNKEAGKPEDENADEEKLKAVENKINAKRGSGRKLDPQVKAEMESSFSEDFTDVHIHDDKEAAELCASLNAQAFAIGKDIFFNNGKYDPGSEAGKELLAHELTHVVQQKEQVQRMVAYRNSAPNSPAAVDGEITDKISIKSPAISLPKTKDKHAGKKYKKPLKTKKGYDRAKTTEGTDAQDKIWKDNVHDQVVKHVKDLTDKVTTPQNPKAPNIYYFETADKSVKLFGTPQTIVENSKVPLWNRNGKVTAYDVDHILELQLEGGENVLNNLELLNFSANRGSGSAISGAIDKLVGQFLKTDKGKEKGEMSLDKAMKDYVVEFNEMNFDKVTGTTPKAVDYWTVEQILAGNHLTMFNVMGQDSLEKITGDKAEPTAFTSPAGGAQITKSSARMPGFNATVTINDGAESASVDAEVGKLSGKLSVNDRIMRPMDMSIPLYKMEGLSKAGYIARRGDGKQNLEGILRRLNFIGLSPVDIHSADILPGKGLVVRGQIKPSVEMIKNLFIDFTIEGDKIELSRTFSSGEIKSIPPPLKISDASITVFAGTAGIGVSGNIDFEIKHVGKGSITGSGNSNGVFKLDGNFNFDEKLFGGVKANVKASYEHVEGAEDKWDLQGNIKIPKGKIKGINSAEINVSYAEKIFKADGSAKFGIPGLEDGRMSVTYGNEQLIIEGEANFKHKLIKSGNVKAKVETAGEETKLSLSGNVKPNIPGIESDLSVSYDNGAFTIMGTVAYAKGRLSGSVTVGVTNRSVGTDGNPAGAPGESLTPFGGGSLTLRITDWLQGTAGVKLLPDGSLEVVGKIGIPAAVNIFEKKEIKKDIFKAPTIEIPIFAIPVGSRSIGLVATIGGGLEGYASIGPGQLTDASVEVTYNPSHEENTKVTGTAKFRVPAEAGLRLYVRAGIGLSIGIARVAGGIEIGGALGIEGAAEAGVTVNWTPTEGFKLDAEASLSVQPKFKFDVNAYIEAVLDLWVTEFSKEWKWNLYSFEWGPAFKFGVKFPVHYEEGKEFNISLDDVQFEKPEISVSDIAKGIGEKLLG